MEFNQQSHQPLISAQLSGHSSVTGVCSTPFGSVHVTSSVHARAWVAKNAVNIVSNARRTTCE